MENGPLLDDSMDYVKVLKTRKHNRRASIKNEKEFRAACIWSSKRTTQIIS